MKIVSYNLFEGAYETKTELLEFIKNENPDVVCFQEANGWDDNQQAYAKEFASEAELPFYAFGDSNTQFKLATFSRLPLLNTEIRKEGFWHSAVRASVQKDADHVDIWNIHLDPRSEANRLDEAKLLASLAKQKSFMGDFNSLSSADEYAAELVNQLNQKGIRKFGETVLLHSVMDYFAEQGLVDTAKMLGTKEWTVPTPANTDAFHADKLRLDYLLATKDLATTISSVKVFKNDLTDKISDHYPLIIEIK